MPKPPRPWLVAPHDPIEKLEDNLWTVDGEIPGRNGARRRMTMARFADGSILFFNAVPISDAALAQVRQWGRPAYLVIPNSFHKMDAHPFRELLGVKLLCDPAIAHKVRARAPVDGTLGDLPADPTVRCVPLAGCKHGETALVVTSPGGRVSAAFADAFMNIAVAPGFFGAILRFGGGPKSPPVFRLLFVKDKRALRGSLERLADTPELARLIPSHGAIVADAGAQTLRSVVARDLG